jgi:hypothetical protein
MLAAVKARDTLLRQHHPFEWRVDFERITNYEDRTYNIDAAAWRAALAQPFTRLSRK